MKRLMEGELTEAQAADKLGKGKGYLRVRDNPCAWGYRSLFSSA